MNKYEDLEDEVIEAIRKCCQVSGAKESALRQFEGVLFTDLIEQALED